MIEIKTRDRVDAKVFVPGSKSLTQRALIAASLANGTSKLIGSLESEDTEYSSAALAQMGVLIDRNDSWTVVGRGGVIEASEKPIYLGNNGTATRFLTSVASLGSSLFVIEGDERMYERPISPMISALKGSLRAWK